MTFGRRLSNTLVSIEEGDADVASPSLLRDSLRYTRKGNRRTDAEIQGILKAKQRSKTAAKIAIKLQREVKSKSSTLIMKDLRGKKFEELSEGDFDNVLEKFVANVEIDEEKFSNPYIKNVEEQSQHELIMAANKRNKEAKKRRKMIRREQVGDKHYPALYRQLGYERVPADFDETHTICESHLRVESEALTSTNIYDPVMSSEFKEAVDARSHYLVFPNGIHPDSLMIHDMLEHGYVEISDKKWCLPSYPQTHKSKMERLVDEIEFEVTHEDLEKLNNLYSVDVTEQDEVVEFSASELIDKERTLETEMSSFDECRAAIGAQSKSNLMSWIHAKTSDKYTLECVDMLVSLVDMLWLVHTEQDYKRRIGIVHLWLSTLGLEVEVKWALSALSALITKLVTATPKVVIAESMSDKLDTALSFMKRIYNTSLLTSVRDFFVSVAALKMFDREVALNIYHYLGKPKDGNIAELMFLAVESLSRVLRVAELIYAGVPLSQALFSDNPVETAKVTAGTLLAYVDNLYTGLPVEGKMCQREWVIAAQAVLPILDNIVKTTNPFKSGYRETRDTLMKLTTAYSNIRNMAIGSSRVPPFCIVLHGDPGIGKSTIMNFLFRIHSDVKKRVFDESHIFHRIVSSDYWEGYDGFSHPYIHYSELGNKNAQLVKVQGDECISELTSVIDSVSMPLNMAFGDKGKSAFIGEMIVIDTNNPGMNLDLLFSNPSAFRRRFIYVKPTVLQEFRKEDSCGIDYEKSKDRRLIDKYSFDCYVQKELDKTHSKTVSLVKDGSVDELYDVLYTLMKERITVETNLLQMKKADVDVKYGTIGSEAKDDDKMCTEPYCSGCEFEHFSDSVPAIFAMDPKSHGETYKRLMAQPLPPVRLVNHGKAMFATAAFKEINGLFAAISDYSITRATLYCRPHHKTEDVEWYIDAVCFSLLCLCTLKLFSDFFFYALLMWFIIAVRNMIPDRIRAHMVNTVVSKKKERILEKLSNLQAMMNGNDLERFTPYIYRGFCALAATGGIAIVIKLIYEYFVKKHSEDYTEFKLESTSNSALNRNEELIGSAFSQKRMAGRVPETWTIVSLKQPIVAPGDVKSLSVACNSNVRFCVIECGNRTTRVCIFGICSNIAIIPTHAVPQEEFSINVSTTAFTAQDCYKVSKIDRSMMVDLGNDMTLISLSQVQFRDVLKHINSLNFSILQGRIADSDVTIKSVNNLIVSNPKGDYVVGAACTYKWVDHKVGFCGMPVYGRVNGGSFILGLHCAGKTGTADAYAALFNVDKLMSGVQQIKAQSQLMVPVSQADMDIEFKDPSFKSPFRFENFHNVEYYGSDGRAVIMPKDSVLRKTKIHDDVDQIFAKIGLEVKEEFAPPVMRPKMVGGQYVSPQNINLKKINTSKKALDRTILAECVKHFVDRVVHELAIKGTSKLSPLPLEEAINGAINDAYLRRINVSTGAGYGFKGKKRSHLPLVDDERECIREPTDELKALLLLRQTQYLAGESSGVIFGAKLKDEPRSKEKVCKGKTRMFYPAPLDYLILARQVLAPIFTLMVEHRNIFNMSVGINMFTEGGDFYNYFAEFADDIACLFDGDYGGYDTSMPYDIGLAASTFIVEFAKAMGYNDHAVGVLVGVMSDSLFPIVELNGDVFKVAGLMVSGGYGTAELNCVRNNILMMYYFAITPGLTLWDYDTKFRKSTYGDDVTGVVKKEISHLFNNVLYAKYCEEVLGMEFTSPDKKVNDVPLRELSQLSFLKRNFVKHPQFDKIMAILDHESIAKSLKWSIPSEALSEIDQVIATANSNLWEMFMRVDRQIFDVFRTDIINAISERYNVELESSDFVASWTRIHQVLCPDAMELKEEEALPSSYRVVNSDGGMSDF